jgi:Ca-activated chloride channel homolog
MKKPKASILFITALTCFSICCRIGAEEINTTRSESPYFRVLSANSNVEAFPLLSSIADVHISGVIADVTIRQIYKNAGKVPIEAMYVFPASTHAAVYSMTMKIADRLLVAEIKEKEEARKTYEKAKQEGKSASLLVQERPNVFQMNVANIMPGDTIIIEMKYTELLVPTDGTYEFVYPTVVGPRYSSKEEKGQDDWSIGPYTLEGVKPAYNFDLNIEFLSGVPYDWFECKTHKMNYSRIDDNHVKMALDPSEKFGGNKDFILSYKLMGDKIQTGLILSQKDKEKYFLLMVQPPKKVKEYEIPPREYIFILDVSGSMSGFPISVSLDLFNKLLSNIRETDLFNLILFSDTYDRLSYKSIPATDENIHLIKRFFQNFPKGGGTEIMAPIKMALNLPETEGYSKTIVVLTDGYVTADEKVIDLIKNNLNNANLFAFGIGSSVNRYLMEGMSRAGKGESFIATNGSDASKIADKFQKYISNPVMTGLKIDFNGFMAKEIEPKNIPDVFADRPILIYGKWQDSPSGTISLSGNTGKGNLKVEIPIAKFAYMDTSSAIKYLFARNKLFELQDYNSLAGREKFKEEITNIGLQYNLLTQYTSFVAVDYLVRANQKPEKVRQPLPLPEGVSNTALSPEQTFSNYSGSSSGYYGGGGGECADPLCPASRRTRYFIGPVYGFNFTLLKNINLPGNDYTKNLDLKNEIGKGFFAGLAFVYPLGNPKDSRSDIEIQVIYNSISLNKEKSANINIPQPNNTLVDVPVKYSIDFRLSTITLNMSYHLSLFNTNIFIGTKIGTGFVMKSKSSQFLEITSADKNIMFIEEQNKRYKDDFRTMIINDGKVPDFSNIQISCAPILGYDLLLGRMYLKFTAGYDFGLTRLMKNSDWNYENVFVGVGVIFSL